MPTKISSYLTDLGFRQLDLTTDATLHNKETAGEFIVIKEVNRMFRYEENSTSPITNTDVLATLDGGDTRWIAVGGASTTQLRVQYVMPEESNIIPLGHPVISKNNVLFVNVSNTQVLSNEFTLNAEKDAIILSESFPAGTETEVVIFVTDFTQTHDYELLTNKPKINNVVLEENKSLAELGIQPEGDYARVDQDNIFNCNNQFNGNIKQTGDLEVTGNIDFTNSETLVATPDEGDDSQKAAPTIWVNALTKKSIEDALETTYSKEVIDQKIDEKDSLPEQTDNEGKFLYTNGTESSWEDLPIASDSIEGIVKLASTDEITAGTSETSVVVVKQLEDAKASVSADLTKEINKKADKTSDFESPITDTNKGVTMKELRDAETTSLTFKGFVSTTEPDENELDLFEGNLWINMENMPEDFPVPADKIKTYDGDSWVDYNADFTPNAFDTFRDINNNEGYYWFGGEWVILSTDLSTEDFVLGDDGKWLIIDSVKLRGLPTVENEPVDDMGIANKQYVDELVNDNTKDKADQSWVQGELDKLLSKDDAASTYETKDDAAATKAELEGKITTASGDLTDLTTRMDTAEANITTLTDDKADKTDIADMLTKTEASSTYETQSNASSTYETKADASNQYQGLQNNIDTKQDALTAGTGITIDPDTNTISVSISDLSDQVDENTTNITKKADKTDDFVTPLTTTNKGITQTEADKKADKTLDFESPITADNKGATMKELRDMETSSLTFKGFVGTDEPDENTLDLFEGNLWINSTTMPEDFPVDKASIKVYDGDNWVDSIEDYSPKAFDTFRDTVNNEGYYWFGGEWVVMSTDLSPTDFKLGDDGKWLIKDSVQLRGLPTVENAPTADMGIANKKYVDDNITSANSSAEKTANKVNSLNTTFTDDTSYPSAKATKDYVDTNITTLDTDLKDWVDDKFDNYKPSVLTSIYQAMNDTNSVISLQDDISIYKYVYNSGDTLVFDVSQLTRLEEDTQLAITFELYITTNDTITTITLPNNIVWVNEEEPVMTPNTAYLLAFRSFDGGTTWLGNIQCRWNNTESNISTTGNWTLND